MVLVYNIKRVLNIREPERPLKAMEAINKGLSDKFDDLWTNYLRIYHLNMSDKPLSTFSPHPAPSPSRGEGRKTSPLILTFSLKGRREKDITPHPNLLPQGEKEKDITSHPNLLPQGEKVRMRGKIGFSLFANSS